MSNWQSNYWASLQAILASAWPEIVPSGAQPLPVVRRDAAMERVDWANLIALKQLTAPWVIVKIEYQPTDQWGIGPKFIAQTTVWYVVNIPAAEAAGEEVVTVIEERLEALRLALMRDQTLGTTLDLVTVDTSADNPVNLTFLEQEVPYQAGSAMAQTIVSGRV